MKVLWLSNSAFVSEKTKATGSWVQPMAEQLATSIKMVNVVDGMVKEPVSCNFRNIKQWIIPAKTTNYGQEASVETFLIFKDFLHLIQSIIMEV